MGTRKLKIDGWKQIIPRTVYEMKSVFIKAKST